MSSQTPDLKSRVSSAVSAGYVHSLFGIDSLNFKLSGNLPAFHGELRLKFLQ